MLNIVNLFWDIFHTHAYIYIYIYIYINILSENEDLHICTLARTVTLKYTHIYTHTHTQTHIYIYMYIYIHTIFDDLTHADRHIFMHTHTHTHEHTHIYIYLFKSHICHLKKHTFYLDRVLKSLYAFLKGVLVLGEPNSFYSNNSISFSNVSPCNCRTNN